MSGDVSQALAVNRLHCCAHYCDASVVLAAVPQSAGLPCSAAHWAVFEAQAAGCTCQQLGVGSNVGGDPQQLGAAGHAQPPEPCKHLRSTAHSVLSWKASPSTPLVLLQLVQHAERNGVGYDGQKHSQNSCRHV